MDSVILENPLLIILFSAALAVSLLSLVWRRAARAGFYVSLALVSVALAYALLSGAGLSECAAVSMVFFILHLLRSIKNGGRNQ